MPRKSASPRTIRVNRAPVLSLWAAVVAERLGCDRDEAFTLGRALAGLNTYSKGLSLGLYTPTRKEVKEKRKKLRAEETIIVDLLHRAVPAVHTKDGLRALVDNRPLDPASVQRYLVGKFGDALKDVYDAMAVLAKSRKPADLAAEAYALYERFRPAVPDRMRGWGAAGILSLDAIRQLAR